MTDGPVALGQNLFRAGRLNVSAPGELHARIEPHLARWSEVCGGIEITLHSEDGPPNPDGDLTAPWIRFRVEDVDVEELKGVWGECAAAEELAVAQDEVVRIQTLAVVNERSVLRGDLTISVTATSIERLAEVLPDLRPGWLTRTILLRRGEVLYSLDGEAYEGPPRVWAMEPPAARFYPDPLKSQPGWTVRADDVDVDRVDAYLTATGTMRARLARWCAPVDDDDWHLVARTKIPAPVSDLGPDFLPSRPMPVQRLAHVDVLTRTVFAYLVGDGVDDGGRELGRALTAQALGEPALAWLADGAAWEAADRHAGVELQQWCARLAGLPELPTLDELCDPDCPWSHHVTGPLRGLLLRVALEQQDGSELIRNAWTGDAEAHAALRDLAPVFQARLLTLREQYPVVRAAAGEAPARRVGAVMTTSPFGGALGSEEARLAIGYLGNSGANTVALWTESSMRVDPDPGGTWLPRHHAGSGEGDVAILLACNQARAFGMESILMPQLLATPSGLPAGQLVRVFDGQWVQLFEDHTRFTEHHALLAELAGAAHLVIGHSLPEMSRVVWTGDGVEKPVQAAAREHKRAGWDRALQASRAAFSGELLFSAAEPRHIEFVDFWDRVDGMGAGCFPYLASDETGTGSPEDEQIRRQLTSFLEPGLHAAAEQGIPLWILPAGFRSTHIGWAGPGRDGGPPSRTEQARMLGLLDDVIDGITARDPSLIGGVLLWRWSTHAPGPDTYPDGRRDYLIRGNQSEKVLSSFAE